MNAKVIVGAELNVPPREMMEEYLSVVQPLRARMAQAVREAGPLAALRDELLPKLISGELRVSEDYVPAQAPDAGELAPA
jgi:type I restriction enzyme S subunit